MDAVQVMRRRAQAAGGLKTTEQQTVTTQGSTIKSALPIRRWFMFQPMIRGWFTEIPSWRGRVGIRIPESGLADRTYRGAAASESAGSAAMDGAGIIGDSIGVAGTRCTAAAGTTPGATHFITGATSTAQEACAGQTATAAKLVHETLETEVPANAAK